MQRNSILVLVLTYNQIQTYWRNVCCLDKVLIVSLTEFLTMIDMLRTVAIYSTSMTSLSKPDSVE